MKDDKLAKLVRNRYVLDERAMSEQQVIKLLKSFESQFMLFSDAVSEIESNKLALTNVLDSLKAKGVDVSNMQKVLKCVNLITDLGKKYSNNTNIPLFDAADLIVDFMEENRGELAVK